MTILICCLIIAALLPYFSKIPLALCMNKAGGYDNNHPRVQQAKLEGIGARSLAAHKNAFESLIVFSSATLLAIVTGTTNESVQLLAVTHVILRIIYNAMYLLNFGLLRSISWAIAIGCSFGIMWQCIPT